MNNAMKFLACNSTVKVTCVNTIKLVNKAKEIHGLSKLAVKIFGEFLTIGAILGADLKDDTDNLTLQVKSDYSQMTCVCKKGAKVKGYIQNEPIFENGTMYIIKDLGLKEPYIGITNIENGDIVKSFVKYYAKSEQIPTVLSAGVVFDENNNIKQAGGYMIQLMPDATEDVIDLIENNVKNTETMTQMLDKNMSLMQIAKFLTKDEDILTMIADIKNEYVCDCSKEKMLNGMATLSKEEIQNIINENKDIETVCHFCNKKYIIKIEELKHI